MAKWDNSWRDYKGPTKEPGTLTVPIDYHRIEMPGPDDFAKTRTKYGAQKTVTYDGVLCDSKKEAARWEQLRLMWLGGQIRDLMPHPAFPLYVGGKRVGRFTGDALYVEDGVLVVEDTKSSITAKGTAYRQRVRTFQACYPNICLREFI